MFLLKRYNSKTRRIPRFSEALVLRTENTYRDDVAYRVQLAPSTFPVCNYAGGVELASVWLVPYINCQVPSENVFQKILFNKMKKYFNSSLVLTSCFIVSAIYFITYIRKIFQ